MQTMEKFPFKSGKKKLIAEQVQVLLDVFGGTVIKGGDNENQSIP